MTKVNSTVKSAAKPRSVKVKPKATVVTDPEAPTVPVTSVTTSYAKFRKWNLILAVLHALQGALVLLLSATKQFSITNSYLAQDSLASQVQGNTVLSPATKHLFDSNLAYLVAVAFFSFALMHLLAATMLSNRYEKDVARSSNRVRWAGYAVGTSAMTVAISILSGVRDIASLVMIVGFIVISSMLAYATELFRPLLAGTGRSQWLPYFLTCVVCVLPGIVVGSYALATQLYGQGLPTYLYFLYVTAAAGFVAYAGTLYLQARGQGTWADYALAERIYMIIGIVFPSLLAWQIFFGALRP